MSHLVDILIPTYNNHAYLGGCIKSMTKYTPSENLFKIHILNNGHPNSIQIGKIKDVEVIEMNGNKGWMGAINEGIKKTSAPFVCFANDDIFIPEPSIKWLNVLLQHFRDPKVGGVGPSSNVVMGLQNMFAFVPASVFTTKFLIGFCVLYSREAIEKVGLLDEELPGGDDFDYGIRMNDKGYKLIINRSVFIYHHGFKTGERILGGADKKGGWNSYDYQHLVDTALIKKHGLKKWFELKKSAVRMPSISYYDKGDVEGDIIRQFIKDGVIVEMGVGATKTVDKAIGVDMIAKGEPIDTLGKILSIADVVADVSQELPFEDNSIDTIIARHILEHVLDPITTILNWKDKLKVGGKLIIAVPNNEEIQSIVMNPEHLHAFSMNSLKNLLHYCGFKIDSSINTHNGVSFVVVAEKV